MKITFTYEITSVNQELNCMIIVYKSDGHPDVQISARLPYEGETLDSIASRYAPFGTWRTPSLAFVVPTVGSTGTVDDALSPIPSFPTLISENTSTLTNTEMLKSIVNQVLAEIESSKV